LVGNTADKPRSGTMRNKDGKAMQWSLRKPEDIIKGVTYKPGSRGHRMGLKNTKDTPYGFTKQADVDAVNALNITLCALLDKTREQQRAMKTPDGKWPRYSAFTPEMKEDRQTCAKLERQIMKYLYAAGLAMALSF
jgi:hypothetical protein